MGGVSFSRVQAVEGGLRFEGEVRLEHNGGFASMRRVAQWPPGSAGARVTARGPVQAQRDQPLPHHGVLRGVKGDESAARVRAARTARPPHRACPGSAPG
jgi:hypothetical protein